MLSPYQNVLMNRTYFPIVGRTITFAPRDVNNKVLPPKYFITDDLYVMCFIVIY